MSFSSPPSPEPVQPANVAPEQLDSNQLARSLPWHFGRRWLPLFWCVSHVYNYRAARSSGGSGGKSSKSGGTSGGGAVVTCDVAGVVACCTEDLLEAIEVNGEIIWAADGGISRDGAHPEHTGDIVIPRGPTFRFHWGTETAAGDWLVLNSGDETHPHYRRQPVLEAKNLNCGTAGTVPNIRVLVERAPRFGGLLDEGRSREGANPITALAELIEDDFAGCGLQGVIDVDTTALVANAIRDRQKTVAVPGDPTHLAYMGYISGYLIDRQSLGAIITSTLENFDGWARRKGEKLEFGFFSHGPIDTSGLLELTLHDFAAEPEFPNPAPDSPDVYTDAIVTGLDRDRNMGDSWQPAGNDVARDRLGETRTQTYARPFLCTSYQQKEQAQELANFYAIAATETQAKFRREKLGDLQPGDRFILNYSPSSVRQVYRVTRRSDPAHGGIVELGIIIERGLAPLTYIKPADPAPTLPAPPVASPVVNARIVQLPAAFVDGPAPVVVALAERPVAAAAGFRVHFSADDVTYDAQAETIDWALRATLVASIVPGTGTFTIAAAGLDLSLLQPQSSAAQEDDALLLFVGGEIMSLGASSALGGGQYSVSALRGRRGSAAASHASAAVCYIIPRAELLQLEHKSFPRTASTQYFKLQTLVLRGEQELATALKLTFTFADTSVNVPSSFAASGAASAVNLAWTNPSDPDLSHVEIFARNTGAGAPGVSDTPDSTEPVVPGGRTLCSRPLTAGTSKDYYIRAVDSASFKSGFVGPQAATALTTTGNFIDYVFKRAAGQPATPTGNGTPAGWSDGPPAGADPLWMSSAEKTYADVLVGAWSTPVRLDGSLTAQYSVTGTGSWHTTFTSGDLFMRISTDGGNTWSSAMRIIGEQGVAGPVGPGLVSMGDYNAATVYFQTSTRRDVVKYSGNYYITNNAGKSGTATWGTPGGADWDGPYSSYRFVATALLLAEDATIKNTIVLGDGATGNGGILRSVSATAFGTGVGVWLNPRNGSNKTEFRVGDPAGNFLSFDGDALSAAFGAAGSGTRFTLGPDTGFVGPNPPAKLGFGSMAATANAGVTTLAFTDGGFSHTYGEKFFVGNFVFSTLTGLNYGVATSSGEARFKTLKTDNPIAKITGDGFAPGLHDGDNALFWAWDSAVKLKVDATVFLIPYRGSLSSAIADPSGGATVDTEARAAVAAALQVLRDWKMLSP